jgi:hypothetical protein
MALRADNRYTGVVGKAGLMESQKGTPGFEFRIDVEGDGDIWHTIWLTPATREYAEKDFAVLDVTPEKLRNESFLRNELDTFVVGKPVTFGTKEEVYNNKPRVRVAWIGKPKAPASSSLQGSVASIFGGGSVSAGAAHPDMKANVDDGDLPAERGQKCPAEYKQ